MKLKYCNWNGCETGSTFNQNTFQQFGGHLLSIELCIDYYAISNTAESESRAIGRRFLSVDSAYLI